MKVVAADDSTWRVRRRWLPWRRRVRDVPDSPIDIGPVGDDPISIVLMVIALVMFVPAFVVLIVLVGELLLLFVLLPLVVLGRGLFGVPWTIEVRRERRLLYTERIRGWSNASRRMDDVATALRLGHAVPARGEATA
ncbi:MAG TPA: hypothetical protein VEX15_03810 [Nocardioidaceae bacterium]|nr:hypothetical protein [Nocardioidaceae bacterium]